MTDEKRAVEQPAEGFEDAYLVTPRTLSPIVDGEESAPEEETQPEEEDVEVPANEEEFDLSELEDFNEAAANVPDITKLPGYEEFAAKFKEFHGVEYTAAMGELVALRAYKQERIVQDQRKELMETWQCSAAQLDERLAVVRKAFAKLSPSKRAELDNPAGAVKIWNTINKGKQKDVPALEKSKKKEVAQSKPEYLYTKAQIAKMSNEEYAKNAQRIAYAYSQGLVKK